LKDYFIEINISSKSTVVVFDLIIGGPASCCEDNSTFRSGHGSSEAALAQNLEKFSTLVTTKAFLKFGTSSPEKTSRFLGNIS